MGSISALDEKTGRKFYLDDPDDLKPGDKVVFLLSLHGGGSVGAWQRAYFPAFQYKEKYRLVIATPSSATKEPVRRWVGEADDPICATLWTTCVWRITDFPDLPCKFPDWQK